MHYPKITFLRVLITFIVSFQLVTSITVSEQEFNFNPFVRSNFFGFNPASKSFPQPSSSSSSFDENNDVPSSGYRSEDKKMVKISNKVGRGINLICNIISANWTFLDYKTAALDVNESLTINVVRDGNELYPWIKCIAIWFPDSVGFMAFNARNTPASNNMIVITSSKEAFLMKGKRKSKLQCLDWIFLSYTTINQHYLVNIMH